MRHSIFDNLKTNCGCTKFYCTTCGGLFHQVQEQEIDTEVISSFFMNSAHFELTRSDTFGRTPNSFPSEKSISGYLQFLIYCFKLLNHEEQLLVINHWLNIEQSLDNWIVDVIGYYLVGSIKHLRTLWVELLVSRSDRSNSISETLLLKYKSLTS